MKPIERGVGVENTIINKKGRRIMSCKKRSTLRKIHLGLSIFASAATLAGIAYLIRESNKTE